MAYALQSFLATGYQLAGPQPQRQTQKLIFGITGTTSDVDLDIGDLSGAFWTAAIADTTYGELASAVHAWLTANYPNWAATSNVFVQELFGRVQAAAASGAAYVRLLNATTGLPEFVFDAANGVAAATVVVEVEMVDGVNLNAISFNPQGV